MPLAACCQCGPAIQHKTLAVKPPVAPGGQSPDTARCSPSAPALAPCSLLPSGNAIVVEPIGQPTDGQYRQNRDCGRQHQHEGGHGHKCARTRIGFCRVPRGGHDRREPEQHGRDGHTTESGDRDPPDRPAAGSPGHMHSCQNTGRGTCPPVRPPGRPNRALGAKQDDQACEAPNQATSRLTAALRSPWCTASVTVWMYRVGIERVIALRPGPAR